ncbi:MAG: hypothetical protein LBQ87_07520 [Candidatus Fibromonas sp.]|nr:hypothetical protein [Candidatus Fibromonas sp.]
MFFGCTNFERNNPDDEKAINYNPNAYVTYSSSSRNSSSSVVSQSGVIYGNPVTYEGETYPTVVIGTQTWFAKNLNYDPPGTGNSACNSACYDCTAYGRLYDWSTAMALPSSCNSSYCSSQIQTKHRGICPSGWHIPNDDDWNVLMDNIGGSSTAGKHLKSKSGWNPYNGIENLDTYGFLALPGGRGNSDGSFDYVGGYGNWWSAREYENGGNVAYSRDMGYNYDRAYWNSGYKNYLFSVRCVQD